MDDERAERVLAIFFLFRLFGSAEREVEVNVGSHRTRELPGLTFPRLFLYLSLPSFPKKMMMKVSYFWNRGRLRSDFGVWGAAKGGSR